MKTKKDLAILNINRATILGITKFKSKTEFKNPNFVDYKNKKIEFDRDIKIYPTIKCYRISPIVKSGIGLYRIEVGGKLKGFTLSYSKDNTMRRLMVVPRSLRIAFDKSNKQLKLVGKDAVGAWQPLITPLYREGELTKLSPSGISNSQYVTTMRKLKEEKQKQDDKISNV